MERCTVSALLADADLNRSDGTFALAQPLRRRFDAMIDGIAKHVSENRYAKGHERWVKNSGRFPE